MNTSITTAIITAEIGATVALGIMGLYITLLSDAVDDALVGIGNAYYRLTLRNNPDVPTIAEKIEKLRRTTSALSNI